MNANQIVETLKASGKSARIKMLRDAKPDYVVIGII